MRTTILALLACSAGCGPLLTANGSLDSGRMIAMAFRDLADNAEKVGNRLRLLLAR